MDGAISTDDKVGLLKSSCNNSNEEDVHVFKYRWLILLLYSITAFCNTLVWLSLFTVSDATCAYYDVSVSTLLWSSTANTFIQVLVAIPASFLPYRMGLRPTMVLATAINAVGGCIMVAGTHRNGFIYFIFGQTVIAFAACLLPQLAPEVSAIWFPPNEHALSTSVGIILGNAGAAIGFLQPALLIKNTDAKNHIPFIGEKLKEMIYSQAALCIILLVAVFTLFKERPKKPPSMAQAQRTTDTSPITFTDFKKCYTMLLRNRNYVLCANAFALSSVNLIVVPVVLNQLVSWKFPHHDATVGWMGFIGIASGIFSSIFFSIILDKTQAFKKLTLALGGTCLILWICFTEILAEMDNIYVTVVVFVLCLFFFIPVGPVIVDTICELTYPVPESISFAFPITLGRFYSIPLVFLLGWLMQKEKFHISCYIIGSIILICCILMLGAKITKNRRMAESNSPAHDQHLQT